MNAFGEIFNEIAINLVQIHLSASVILAVKRRCQKRSGHHTIVVENGERSFCRHANVSQSKAWVSVSLVIYVAGEADPDVFD